MFHCTKCRKEFKALLRIDDEIGDESYDVCPFCSNDMDLENGSLPESLKPKPLPPPPPVKERPFRSKEQWEADREEMWRKEDVCIEEYQRVHELQGQGAAEEVFFNKRKELL